MAWNTYCLSGRGRSAAWRAMLPALRVDLRFDVLILRTNLGDSSAALLDGHELEAPTASWHPSPFSRALQSQSVFGCCVVKVKM